MKVVVGVAVVALVLAVTAAASTEEAATKAVAAAATRAAATEAEATAAAASSTEAAAATEAGTLMTTSVSAAPAVALCNTCACNITTVNCAGLVMDELPLTVEGAWPQGVQVADFMFNILVHVGRLPALPQLRYLSFRENRLRTVDDGAFADLPLLEELDLSSNELAFLTLRPPALQNPAVPSQPLANLQILRLQDNKFGFLQSDFFAHAPNVRELSIGDNPIPNLESPTLDAVCSLQRLQALNLSRLKLRDLPERLLDSLPQLQRLDLRDNQFAAVPAALAKAKALQELRLSDNPVEPLDAGAFPPALAALRTLEMQRMNNLERVGKGALRALTGLQRLVLADSRALVHLDPEAFADFGSPPDAYPALRELVLRENGLRTLHPDLLANWKTLRLLDLQYNYWHCDCNLTWVAALEPIIRQTPEFEYIPCTSPKEVSGYNIYSKETLQITSTPCGSSPSPPAPSGSSGFSAFKIALVVGAALAVLAPVAYFAVRYVKRRHYNNLTI